MLLFKKSLASIKFLTCYISAGRCSDVTSGDIKKIIIIGIRTFHPGQLPPGQLFLLKFSPGQLTPGLLSPRTITLE